jgi:predicted nucleic acid-binding protein
LAFAGSPAFSAANPALNSPLNRLGLSASARSYSQPVAAQFVSAITVLELELGVLQKERKDVAQGAVLRAWLDGKVLPQFAGRILPLDQAVALRCARLHLPDPRAERDAIIAATALVHGMTIVTRNVADFEATGAPVINPWE